METWLLSPETALIHKSLFSYSIKRENMQFQNADKYLSEGTEQGNADASFFGLNM